MVIFSTFKAMEEADWKDTAWAEWRKQNTKSLALHILKFQGQVLGPVG